MNSSDYKALIEKYENIISKIKGLYSYLGNCSSAITLCKPLFEETQIDGEAIDNGKLDNISIVLENLKEAFNTVIAECKLKIASYEVLYAIAFNEEQSGDGTTSL